MTWRRLVVTAAALLGIVVGALHLPLARPLLARLRVSCPVESVSSAQVERMHRVAAAGLRGTTPTPTIDVLGLTLQAQREADVRTWAAARRLRCTTQVRGLRYLSCADVPFGGDDREAADPIRDVTFTFDRDQVLIGVDALHSGLPGTRAATLASAIARRLQRSLGPPNATAGAFDVSYLEGGVFRTAYVKYQFTNALVTLIAVQMPGRGVTVREQYVGLTAPAPQS
jgi:hypothetical protein